MAKQVNGKLPEGRLWTHEELLDAIGLYSGDECRTIDEWMSLGYVTAKWAWEKSDRSTGRKTWARLLDAAVAAGGAERVRICVAAGGRMFRTDAVKMAAAR